jgi:hypothetical protein
LLDDGWYVRALFHVVLISGIKWIGWVGTYAPEPHAEMVKKDKYVIL